jgi:hypothetical protein
MYGSQPFQLDHILAQRQILCAIDHQTRAACLLFADSGALQFKQTVAKGI